MSEADFSEQNLRLMMELPRRLAACQADPIRGKRQLLRGLCRLVNAVTGVGAMLDDDFTVVGEVTIVQVDPADDSAESLSLCGEIVSPSLPVLFTPAPLATTLRELERPIPDPRILAPTAVCDDPEAGARLFCLDNPLVKPFIQAAARNNLEPTALARVEAVVDRQWYRSAFFRRFLAPMGLDDCILSIVPLPGMQPFIAVVCLSGPLTRPIDQCQRGGEAFFAPRQRRIVEIAHSQLRWVYYPQTTSSAIEEQYSAPVRVVCPSGPELEKLAPRYQRVLNHLLCGGSEKELANHLGLSRFTIHEYVRAIYKKLNVNSRSELMARWVPGASTSNLLAS